MVKKLLIWSIVFGLSFLVSEVLGCTEQGNAFLYISVVPLIGLSIFVIIADHVERVAAFANANKVSYYTVLEKAGQMSFILFATWVATKLSCVDFYFTYQIMTFGQCICDSRPKNND